MINPDNPFRRSSMVLIVAMATVLAACSSSGSSDSAASQTTEVSTSDAATTTGPMATSPGAGPTTTSTATTSGAAFDRDDCEGLTGDTFDAAVGSAIATKRFFSGAYQAIDNDIVSCDIELEDETEISIVMPLPTSGESDLGGEDLFDTIASALVGQAGPNSMDTDENPGVGEQANFLNLFGTEQLLVLSNDYVGVPGGQ